MKVYLCVDDNNGMMFNHRRQSRDSVVIQDIIKSSTGFPVFISPYSSSLFAEYDQKIVSDDFLFLAGPDDPCFVEDRPLAPFEKEITELTVYHWNRSYPADVKLDLNLTNSNYKLLSVEELVGTSHEKITKEVYIHATENEMA